MNLVAWILIAESRTALPPAERSANATRFGLDLLDRLLRPRFVVGRAALVLAAPCVGRPFFCDLFRRAGDLVAVAARR